MRSTRYILLVFGSALASASGIVVTEVALRFFALPSLWVAVPSNSIGGLFLLTCALSRGRAPWRDWPARDWLRLLIAATLVYAIGFFLLYEAVDRIGASKAALLSRLEVILVVALAVIFLGERWTLRHWLASLLAVAGAVLVNFDPAALELTFGLGEALALLAAIVYASGIVLLKSLVDRQDACSSRASACYLGL